jgi:hypothetical protein
MRRARVAESARSRRGRDAATSSSARVGSRAIARGGVRRDARFERGADTPRRRDR